MGKGSQATPKNWPASLPYLTHPSYSPHLAKEQLRALKIRGDIDDAACIPASLPFGPSASVKITPIAAAGHPACGQAGLFAARALAPGSLIVPYVGVVHSARPPYSAAHERSDYDLWLDRDAEVAVDAAAAGNEARFVNDYRGVRVRPNAEFRECWDSRRAEKTMAVFVLPATKKSPGKKGGGRATAAAAQGIAKGT